MKFIPLVIQKSVLALPAFQPSDLPASLLCLHRGCFGIGERLAQILCAAKAKFRFLNHSRYIFLLLLAPMSLFCGETDSTAPLVKANTELALDLYAANNAAFEGNQIFSPYSIGTCLEMLYMGARGETADELEEVLHTDSNREALAQASLKLRKALESTLSCGKGVFKVSNALWVDQEAFLLSTFRQSLEDSFLAKVARVPFRTPEVAIQTINTYVSSQTEGKIPNLLQPGDLTPSTHLVLTNTIYFNSPWKFPFDSKNTKEGVFHAAPGKDIPSQMMEQTLHVNYYENDLLQAVMLPFVDSSMECVLILPKSSENMITLEEQLLADLEDWVSYPETSLVNLKIPKSTLRQRINLQSILEKLGMKTSFTTQANFAGINGKLDLYVDKIITEAFVSLDEIGVMAAAATAAGMNMTALPPVEKVQSFIVDHPCLLLLRDAGTGTIVFMGKIAHP